MDEIVRPGEDAYFLEIARVVATRSTCPRRSVGCVLVDKNKHILATGYNGVPRGMPHCIDEPCDGATANSGEHLNKCLSIHAEQNALIQCPDTEAIKTAYVTCSPCMHCVKMLANTSIEHLVFSEMYCNWLEVRDFWLSLGKTYAISP